MIIYALPLNSPPHPSNSAPDPAAAPAGDTSNPTPHSSARTYHAPSRPARSPRLLLPLSAQYAWCRWRTASRCKSSQGPRACVPPTAAPADTRTATGGRYRRNSLKCLYGRLGQSD